MSDINPSDIEIFTKVTELVYDARHCVANSYALGYFLTSPQKIDLFEFMQGDLESRLDALDEATDKPLEEFLTESTPISFTPEYWDHRTELMTLYDVVSRNYNDIMRDAEAGFPQVTGDIYDEEEALNEALLR